MGRKQTIRSTRSEDNVDTNIDPGIEAVIKDIMKDCNTKDYSAVKLLVNLHAYLSREGIDIDKGFRFKDDAELKKFEEAFWPEGKKCVGGWMNTTFKNFRDALGNLGFEHNHKKADLKLKWVNELFTKENPQIKAMIQLRRSKLSQKTDNAISASEETGGSDANAEKEQPQETPATILGLVQQSLANVESRSQSISNTMTEEFKDQLKDFSYTNELVNELGKLLEVEQLPSSNLVSQAIECMLVKSMNRWAPNLEVSKAVIEVLGPCLGLPMGASQLRSAIFLDVVVRMLNYAGVEVIGKSLVGDSGDRFGMLMEHLVEISPDLGLAEPLSIADLEAFHDAAQTKRIEDVNGFRSRAKAALNLLNRKDPKYSEAYSKICSMSRDEYKQIYERLGVMSPDETCVSTYDEDIQDVVMDLTGKGIIQKSIVTTGNQVICGESNGMEVKIMTSDGDYSIHATFLTALCNYLKEKKDAWIVYVTDAGESENFQILLNAAKQATSDPDVDDYKPKMTHMGLGDFVGNPSSGVIGLLNTVKKRCIEMLKTVEGKNWSEEVVEKIAEIVSIGALKYADLKNDRDKSYTFSLDEMLSHEGNSAYSIQHAHAYISRLISSHGTASLEYAKESGRIVLLEEAELTLGRHLASFTQVVEKACLALKPHFLCDYLYLLWQNFYSFSLTCPTYDETGEVNCSRLLLCEATQQVFQQCFHLLSINSVVDICDDF